MIAFQILLQLLPLLTLCATSFAATAAEWRSRSIYQWVYFLKHIAHPLGSPLTGADYSRTDSPFLMATMGHAMREWGGTVVETGEGSSTSLTTSKALGSMLFGYRL